MPGLEATLELGAHLNHERSSAHGPTWEPRGSESPPRDTFVSAQTQQDYVSQQHDVKMLQRTCLEPGFGSPCVLDLRSVLTHPEVLGHLKQFLAR